MTAREEFLRGLHAAGGWPDGDPEELELADADDLQLLDLEITARARRLEAKYGWRPEPVR